MALEYEDLRKKYGKFAYPLVTLTIGEEEFSQNKGKLVLSNLSVDLSTGLEASVATFSLYNVYDKDAKEYNFSKFKSYVALGSSVKIAMGYAGGMQEIFVGFIAQTRFVREEGSVHHVEVTAMDVKGMMMANSYAKSMTATNFGDAIKEIFNRPFYQKMQSEGIYTDIKISDTPDKKAGDGSDNVSSYTVEMVSESDYEFIVKAAKRFGYEFFVDTGVLTFRKAKDTPEDVLITLGMKKGISTYDITYDITGLVKTVEVRGMDTAKGALVKAAKSVSNKISTGNKAKSLISQTSRVVIDGNATTKESAQYRADSLMEDIQYRFGTLNCNVIGMPDIKPGHFIQIEKLGGPCDNKFYVTHTVHTIDDLSGYRTEITAIAAALS